MTTEQLLQRFKKADKEQKLIKLQEIMKMLKDTLPMIEDIDTHLKNTWTAIEESTLITYYSIIIKNAEYLENKKISEYEGFMKKLRDKETKAQEAEDNSLEHDLSSI